MIGELTSIVGSGTAATQELAASSESPSPQLIAGSGKTGKSGRRALTEGGG